MLTTNIQTSIQLLNTDNKTIDHDEKIIFTSSSPTERLSQTTGYESSNQSSTEPETISEGHDCLKLENQTGDKDTNLIDNFFSATNPGTNKRETKKIESMYKASASSISVVGQEIAQESVNQSEKLSIDLDQKINKAVLYENQCFCIDPKTGKGLSYLHERDRQYEGILSGNEDIHVFLPGYATGDRYTLIFTALIEPKLNISIAYSAGNKNEEKAAKEAYDVIIHALKRNGETNPEKRITLLSYKGDNLKKARESLDSPNTKSSFDYVQGAKTSSLMLNKNDSPHVFHISVTTEIINRSFQDESTASAEKYQNVRDKLANLVTEEDRKEINHLVDKLIDFHKIKHGDVILWTADREYANAREAEAISRPKMFEQIAQHLKSDNIGVCCIADTYINRAKSFENKDIIVNRHPYRMAGVPHIGRFWTANVNGKQLLAPRENQWYFMDRLLSNTGGRIIGIRSGALEPFALMGHNVIYLEHKNMFTPERHASWQGWIPYRRLITEKTTGYLNLNTEIRRNEKINEMISIAEVRRKDIGTNPFSQEQFSSAEFSKLSNNLDKTASLQDEIQIINEDINTGLLSRNELTLLTQMLKSEDIKTPAADVIQQNPTLFT
jgi:hypothetical protein